MEILFILKISDNLKKAVDSTEKSKSTMTEVKKEEEGFCKNINNI